MQSLFIIEFLHYIHDVYRPKKKIRPDSRYNFSLGCTKVVVTFGLHHSSDESSASAPKNGEFFEAHRKPKDRWERLVATERRRPNSSDPEASGRGVGQSL